MKDRMLEMMFEEIKTSLKTLEGKFVEAGEKMEELDQSISDSKQRLSEIESCCHANREAGNIV